MNRGFELFVGLIGRLVLDIQYGWQVTILQLDGFHKMGGLLIGGCMNTIEMISTSCKTVFTGLEEIVFEVLVCLRGTFRSLDHDEAYRTIVDTAVVLEFIPVDTSLMMRDINTMNLIAIGIVNSPVKGTPTETKWSDKEIIEEPDIKDDNSTSA